MQKGLRKRNSPMCTLSQNGYGVCLCRPTQRAPRLPGTQQQAKKKFQERENGRRAEERKRSASKRCGLAAHWEVVA
jgi:hypothetical protein